MYYYEEIDEDEYQLVDEYHHIWEYQRKNPINIYQKDNGNHFIYKNNVYMEDVYFGEVVGSRIAEATIGNACRARLAKKHRDCTPYWDNGVISYYYLAEGDKIFSIYYLLGQYYEKEYGNNYSLYPILPSMDTVIKALSYSMTSVFHRPFAELDVLKQQYIDMIMFDCKLGNYDRTLENWMIYQDALTQRISMYPLFDNEAVLGFDEPIFEGEDTLKEIIQYCHKQKTRYIVTESKDLHQFTAGEVVKFLLQKYPKEARISLNKVRQFSLSDLTSLLEEFPDMSEERKNFTKKMFVARSLLLNRYEQEVNREKNKERI